jgi:hypothetical protein
MNAKTSMEAIQQLAPKAWEDLKTFYSVEVKQKSGITLDLEQLPFELMMGVIYRYFQENAVEWDVLNITFEQLPESLIEVFENYEKSISHFS